MPRPKIFPPSGQTWKGYRRRMAEKIIGILGGMGPEATRDLFDKIINETHAVRDQDHLRIIIDNNPKVPDRTRAIIGDGESPVPEMAASANLLARAGADFIVIPCISAHFFLDSLQRESDIPILSAFEAVSEHIVTHHPDVDAVGLLATTGTVQGGRFQEVLSAHGIQSGIPGAEDQAIVMDIIYRVKAQGADQARSRAKAELTRVSRHLIESGAKGIVAGCTELPLVLESRDLPVPLFDPLTILARAAVRRARPVAA